tara:strand:- start:221 stop:931 length:711 start_codon:yes stop_codon:yes gene_type:complete
MAEEQKIDAFITEGERLHYKLRWGFLNVGTAVLEVHPKERFNGEPCFHYSLTIRTNKVADKFYKVRTTINSIVSIQSGQSLHYTKRQQEGKTNRNIEVTFDWKLRQAQYSNFGRLEAKVPLTDGVVDPLAVIYHFRTFPYTESSYTIPTTDGKKVVPVVIELGKRSVLKTKAGKFKAVKIEPDIKDLKGVFYKSKEASLSMWYSEDENRYPVRIKSKVAVGSFVADLVKIEQLEVY